MSKLFDKIVSHFESVGLAMAASRLSAMGMHEEAKHLMLERGRKSDAK